MLLFFQQQEAYNFSIFIQIVHKLGSCGSGPNAKEEKDGVPFPDHPLFPEL
jgi:hypothetical protein